VTESPHLFNDPPPGAALTTKHRDNCDRDTVHYVALVRSVETGQTAFAPEYERMPEQCSGRTETELRVEGLL
jgi:hypothetical protein